MTARTKARATAYRRLAWKATYAGNARAAERYRAKAAQLDRQAEHEATFTDRLRRQAERRREGAK